VRSLDPPPLRISAEADGSGPVLRVAGELDLATAEQLRAHLRQVTGPQPVVVDLAGVDFLDVTGLNVLLDAHRALRAQGGRLVLRRPRPMVLRMLSLLDLPDAVAVES
jgi:anti-anti-sigma factor